MRHKGMSVLVASQDPPSVPIKLIELSDVGDPAQVQFAGMAAAHAEGGGLARGPDPAKMASLAPGEAYVWSSKSTEPDFTRGCGADAAAPSDHPARRRDEDPHWTEHGAQSRRHSRRPSMPMPMMAACAVRRPR